MVRYPVTPVRPSCLTRRQIEVLELAMGGRTDEEVAKRLATSPETVKRQFQDMFNRTGMSGRIELMNFVLKYPEWVGMKSRKRSRRKSGT